MTEKKTLQELIIPVKSMDAITVANAIIATVKQKGLPLKTLTVDNGVEFARHELRHPLT